MIDDQTAGSTSAIFQPKDADANPPISTATNDIGPPMMARPPTIGADRLPVARPFQNEVRDQRDAFGIVELDPSREPSPGDQRRERDHEFVLFPWREIHRALHSMTAFNMTTSSAP